jgi:glycosyltransferase involved in cell wall biosynthesis
MMNKPAISIIIPFFNRLEWTHDAVKSVLAQTYQDFEIILIDDGSTEDYRKKYGIEDIRIKYYRQENRGRSAARNYGLQMAEGKYITFLDSDDLYTPFKLEKQFQILETTPEAGMVYTNFLVMNESGVLIKKTENSRIELSGNIYPDLLFIQGTCITTPSVMVRREIFELTGGFDETMHICEDLDLWRRIARITSIVQIREPYIYVRYKNDPGSLWVYTRGRIFYYKKAIQDDPSLKPLRRSLYIDMYFHYCEWSLKRIDLIYFVYAYANLVALDAREALRFILYIINKIRLKLSRTD